MTGLTVAPDLDKSGKPRKPLTDEEIHTLLSTRHERPTASSLLGFSPRDFSVEERWIEAGFDPDPRVANLRGGVQGGIVAAMLDEVMSLSVLVAERFTCGVPTLELKISFFAPLPVGPCKARGEAMKIGGRSAFMEGSIWTPDGELAARASATCQVRRVKTG